MAKEKMEAEIVEAPPEELEYLLPKSGNIMIGKEQHEIEELAAEDYKKIIDTVALIYADIWKLRNDESAKADEDVFVSKLFSVVADRIIPIISVATGMEETELHSRLTARQLVYAAKIVWDVNFNGLMDQWDDLTKTVDSKVAGFVKSMAGGSDEEEETESEPEIKDET
jgi:hypothetical protein